ncbi:hypothetical protein [Paraburkholderia sp.]|uniref:hypothetical protein n=1 Tax=Paraburkholderia sp. TaxID=1926495 RepID=UPI0039E71E73
MSAPLVDIAAARSPDEPRSAHEHRRQKAFAAPVIIVLGVAITTKGTSIPEFEPTLSAGAAD